MAETFKSGDIVQLKSGGPTMTVRDPDCVNDINCQWFAGKKLEWGLFNPESLIHIKEEK